MSGRVTSTYVGQVERDSQGALWAVLYCGEHVASKEQVRSLRKGRRRVADLVLSASDSFAELERPLPTHLNRFVEQRPATRRHHIFRGSPAPTYANRPTVAGQMT